MSDPTGRERAGSAGHGDSTPGPGSSRTGEPGGTGAAGGVPPSGTEDRERGPGVPGDGSAPNPPGTSDGSAVSGGGSTPSPPGGSDSSAIPAGARIRPVRLSWVRVRLRTARGAAFAVFALVLVTAFLAAAMPRAVDRYQDSALRQMVHAAQPQSRGINLAAGYTPQPGSAGTDPLGPAAVDRVERTLLRLVGPPARIDASTAVYGVRSAKESTVLDQDIPRLSPHPPAASVVAQAGLEQQVRVVAGRLPAAVPPGRNPATVEAAVTVRTAQVLHLKVGQTVHLGMQTAVAGSFRVSGILAPRQPGSLYWHEDDDLLAPVRTTPPTAPGGDPYFYWHFTLLVDRTAADVIPRLGQGNDLYWHNPLADGSLTAHDVPALQKEITALQSGPLAARLQSDSGTAVHADSGIGPVLTDFAAQRSASSPLVLVAAVGVGTAALAVLLMAGGLAAERRRGEVALLRSRGGSLRGIALRLAGETAAAAVPGGALGTLLALLLLPTERWELPLLLGALATAAGVLALPLRAAGAVRKPRPAAREDVATARPSRRRLVAELTVLVLVAGAVAALRQRGGGGAGADGTTGGWGDDPFVAAAPVLVAVAAAIVLLRLYPLPLRLLARPTARLSGAVTHLGLARAGRSPATGQLPLLAMLVALTVASFGGSVLAGVDHGRDRAAVATVGADARVDATQTLAPQLPGQIRKVPGVGVTATVRVEPSSAGTFFAVPYSVVIVDPASYVKLTAAIGLPGFPAGALTGERSGKGAGPGAETGAGSSGGAARGSGPSSGSGNSAASSASSGNVPGAGAGDGNGAGAGSSSPAPSTGSASGTSSASGGGSGSGSGESSAASSGSGSGDSSGAGSDASTVLPAVLSPQLAAQLGNRTTSVSTGLGPVTIRTAAVVSTTPAVPGDQFVILSAARLAALHPSAAAYPQTTAPTTVLAMNAPGRRIDGAALRAAVRDSTTSATVLLLTQQRAALADTPLQHGARRIYLAAVVAGALYSALAMLLSLLQAAPGRKTLLARLRTMGMTRRQSRRLVLLEMLPQALLAAVGGALVGLAVIPLLGPGIDLRALAFGTGPRDLAPVDFGLGLRADPWSLVLPSAALLVLACAVLLTQAWLTARRQESTELRAGDQA